MTFGMTRGLYQETGLSDRIESFVAHRLRCGAGVSRLSDGLAIRYCKYISGAGARGCRGRVGGDGGRGRAEGGGAGHSSAVESWTVTSREPHRVISGRFS